MIGAGISYYNSAENYLAGNAKVYDGAFDYDIIPSWSQLTRTTVFSMLFAFNSTDIGAFTGTFTVFAQGQGTGTPHFTVRIVRVNPLDFRINISMQNSTGNRISKDFNITSFGRDVYCIAYTGSSTSAGFRLYKNGVEIIGTTASDTLTLSIISTNTNAVIGAFRGATAHTFFYRGTIRQLEIINRVATAGEIANASASGSFRGAGITHASGEYLLAIDFDKVNGQDLTTFAGTPAYAITAFGGATYTPYL